MQNKKKKKKNQTSKASPEHYATWYIIWHLKTKTLYFAFNTFIPPPPPLFSCKLIAVCLLSVLTFVYSKSLFSRPQSGIAHIFTKACKIPWTVFRLLWSLNAILLPFFISVSKGYFIAQTLPTQPDCCPQPDCWRREAHHSLCSVLSKITRAANCRSCSASRTGGVRNSCRVFLRRCTVLMWHLPSNQVLKLQARKSTCDHPSWAETTDPLISVLLIRFGVITSTRGVICCHGLNSPPKQLF